MRRQIEGLHDAGDSAASNLPDGLLLVRVIRSQHRWESHKPYYWLSFSILEPIEIAGRSFTGRIYSTPKALWKLNWFLRDFGYDTDLLGRDEIDDKRLVGLHGVVKITHTVLNGRTLLNLDGFAPAARWQELSSATPDTERTIGREVFE